MAVGDIITAARYNAMQSKVNLVLGNGVDQFGYGQPVDSSLVLLDNTVNALHMQALKADIIDAYVHQTGSLPILTDVLTDNDITDVVYNEYETLSNYVYNNKNDIFVATQSTTEFNKISSTRTTQWGGDTQPQSIFHEFSVTFATADARRHFFNSGGEIWFVASLTGGTGSKNTAWSSMLASMGTIKFNYDTLTALSGLSSNIGNFELTNTYQVLYVKSSAPTYTNNDYTIRARGAQTSNVIQFQIEFNDGDSGLLGQVDEPVTGTLTSTISQLRATGLYVNVPSPTYQNIVNLS